MFYPYLRKLVTLLLFLSVSYVLQAQTINGTVYRDFNGNGIFENTAPDIETGISGILINAYNSSNALAGSTSSGSDGTYSLNVPLPVRLEFVIPNSGACVNPTLDYNGFSGDGNNVRFVSAPGTYNYAMLSPDQFALNKNPKIYVPMYVQGDPLGGGTSGSNTGFWGYDFTSDGIATNSVTAPTSAMGATWGVAYSKQAQKIFAASFVKRHVGLGPLGSGGIYMLQDNGSSFSVSNFYDLDANGYRTRATSSAVAYGNGSSYSVSSGTTISYLGGIDPESGDAEGLGVIGSNSTRGLPINMDVDSYDPAAFDQVGKVGLGDLDISDDGKFLFVMNLYSRKVYRLELNDAYNPTSVISVTSYALPALTANNGVIRPFALQFHRNKLYVGAVASAESNSGTLSDLRAYVLELNNPTGSASFNSTPILDFALDYKKGYPMLPMNSDPYRYWHPWSHNSANVNNLGEQAWSSPILSNIEFNDREDMILDFLDRGGHQYGYNIYLNLDPSAPGTSMYDVSGDILVAGKNCSSGGWTLESNGSYNSDGVVYTSAGAGNTEGIGGGEFYYRDVPPDEYHHETSQGAAAIVPGTGEGVFTLMDANSAFSGGTGHFNHYTALDTKRLNLYGGTDGFLSKANGLGDIEVAGEEPPLEIGNRVWLDTDNDGIQDANESGIQNVNVYLYCDFDNNNIPDGSAIANTSTDADGYWYFNEANVNDGDCATSGNQAGLQLNKNYLVIVGSGSWNSAGHGTGVLANKFLTGSNATVIGIADASDNDATLISNYPTIPVTTSSKWGENNHSYDFGFTDTPPCSVTASVVAGNQSICSGGDPVAFTQTSAATGSGTLGYQWQSSTTDCNSGFSDISGANSNTYNPPSGLTATTYYHVVVTNTDGSATCTATSNCITVTVNPNPSADAGQDKTLDCSTTSATIGTAAVSGNTYSWNPATGLSASNIAEPTASSTSTTTYTVTVSNGFGCSASDIVTVTVNTTPPMADAGQDQSLDCSTTSASIGTAAISGNTYSWNPTSGLSASNVAQPTASPSTSTNYTVTVTGSNGCTASDIVSVTVNTNPPTANAGQDQSLDCSITSASIGTAAISGNTYSWNPSSGLSASNVAQPTASPTSTTNYTVIVTGSNGCTASDIVSVTVNTNPPAVDAGQDQSLDCTTTSTFIGTAPSSGNNYSWSPSTGLTNANVAQPTAHPSSTTNYTVTVIGSNGCTASDVVTVQVDTNPPTADAGQDRTLNCSTPTATIGTAALAGNTYSWNPSTGLSASNIAQPTASSSSTTTYTLTVTGSNGCSSTDEVTVTVDTNPPTANAGQDQSLDCSTTSTLIGTAALSGNTYVWSPSAGLNDATMAMPTATSSTTTTYTVTVTGSNGCTASDIMVVTVNTTPPAADAGQNKTIDCATTSVTIGTTAISGLTYNWDPGTGLNDATLAQPNASPSATTNYTLTVTSANGCTATDVVTVTVNGNLGSIGNYVWEDLNANGINDEPTTSGINGVSVELWKETAPNSGVYAPFNTTATANNAGNPGYYSFSICDAANYKIKFPTTFGIEKLTLQNPAPGTDANSDASILDGFSPAFAIDPNGSGVSKDNPTIDAGYYATACLGNYVWIDQIRNNIQDATEVGVAGITVMLFDNSNTVVSTTVTNAYGLYHFCDLMPGDYHVGFTLPSNYVYTTSNVGANDQFDNDADPITGLTGTYTLQSGDDNLSVDAGIYFVQPTTASVGNYVWLDVNQDGIQDPTEMGISGVTVILYDNGGNAVATTITDGNGFYLFTNVNPGNYSVGFTPPVGLTMSPNNGAVSNPSNSDANPLTGMTSTFTVNAGDQITYVDAGLYQLPNTLGSLGDKVWYDLNQDGMQDTDEPGVSGVTVTLYGADGSTVLATTTTNTYGNYIFNNLVAGDYVVGFSNIPTDYTLTSTSGTDSTTNSDADLITGKTNIIHLGAGQHNMTYDAGIYNTNTSNTNSIGNYVWYDINKDGLQDANETGVSGITVTLYDNSLTALKTTSTDANGFYLFPNLPNGTYSVGFSNLPSAYQVTTNNVGSDDALDSDVDPSTLLTASTILTGNTHDMTLDAGMYANNSRLGKGTLGDKVWYDLNGNGLQEANESGVVGVTVTLYGADGTTVLGTTITDALGNYIFTNLDQGGYVVGFSNLPSGFSITPQNSDSQGVNGELNSDVNPATEKTPVVFLAQGEDKMSVDMGLVPPAGSAGLGNYVWIDIDHNGLQDTNEPGVAGVTVTLYSNTEAAGVTTTDSRGLYQFIGLTPGNYSVGFSNLPSGYNLTLQNTDAAGINGAANSDANISTGLTASVTLAAGDFNPNLDAGIHSTTVASLGDYVWFDLDADGIQDSNEPGVGGILVTLFDDNTNSPLSSMITNPEGGYLFTNLQAGTYYLSFSNIPTGLVFTTQESNPNAVDGSNVDPLTAQTPSVVLAAGTHNPTIDAGLIAPGTAGLGDYVWHDINKNGQQNAGEPAIAGVLVTLYDGAGSNVLATAVTDGAGNYSFVNLHAGDYSIGFNAPTLFTPEGARVPIPTTANNGADVSDNDADPITGRTGVYSLTLGQFDPTIDAGFYYQFATPVNLQLFEVTSSTCSAVVHWTTAMEKNADHFVVYRKQENNAYAPIATVKALGNTSLPQDYVITDRNVNSGSYTYQLKLVDIDGNYTWSKEQVVLIDCGSESSIQVYPNPMEDVIMLQIISTVAETTEISLLNTIGQVLIKQQGELEVGNNIIQIPVQHLATGTYYLKVNSNGIPYTIKLTKQ